MRTAWLAPVLVFILAPLSPAAPPSDFQPDPQSVQRYGSGYRYPQAGWIVLHIEGEPYERGVQHGRLLAPEIAGYVRCFAAEQSPKSPSDGWKLTRQLVDALFLRRYDREYLEEMRGIADGAAAAGAKFNGRPIDLTDIVAVNAWAEVITLGSALNATPTGLEGLRLGPPAERAAPPPKGEHCSAFAATGPATADGKIVFGHITMFGLYPSNFFNVWLDIKPSKGHRVCMQSYPGGIQSGMDYYMNDAGLLVCETTIRQTKFDPKGTALASRIRQALQYAADIDRAVQILEKDNNGLYTNEWLLGDVKTNEIAMFELGTTKTRLWRSSKNEWFGGTEGFYWGCNNAKDLDVRLDGVTSTEGKPANVVFRPSDRDRTWLKLYQEHRGKIGVGFGKLAFTTPPVAAYPSLDAKFTTTDMAKDMKTWALFGPPLGRTWQPTFEQRRDFPEIRPLVSNAWTVLHTEAPAKVNGTATAVDLPDEKGHRPKLSAKREGVELEHDPVWRGTLLPKSDADVWLAAAFADYERYVAVERAMRRRAEKGELTKADREQLDVMLFQHRSGYLTAVRSGGDVPLVKTRSEVARDEWYRIAAGKGVLLLHDLRKQLGDEAFVKFMDEFGRAHAGREVTADAFRAMGEKLGGKKLDGFFSTWLTEPGLPNPGPSPKPPTGEASGNGGTFGCLSFQGELGQTLIVVGTADDAAGNRSAATALRDAIRQGPNVTVQMKTDGEVTDEELKSHHVLLVGRPATNRVTERFQKTFPVAFGTASFAVNGERYAHAGSAVVAAGDNPLERRYSAVVIAGMSAEATHRAATAFLKRGERLGDVLILPHDATSRTLVATRP